MSPHWMSCTKKQGFEYTNLQFKRTVIWSLMIFQTGPLSPPDSHVKTQVRVVLACLLGA